MQLSLELKCPRLKLSIDSRRSAGSGINRSNKRGDIEAHLKSRYVSLVVVATSFDRQYRLVGGIFLFRINRWAARSL